MLSNIINVLPIALTLITGFGVMIHDTKLDHATVTAMSSQAGSVHATGSLNNAPDIRSNDHTHAESVRIHSLGHQEPRLQTRDTDTKKFVNTKKLAFSTSFT